MRGVEFQILQAITNIRRNGLMTLAAVIISATTLLFLGVFLLALWNLGAGAEHSASQIRVLVYCHKTVPLEDAQALEADIRAQAGDLIEGTTVRSKEELLADAGRMLNMPLDGLEGDSNPFGPCIEISLTDPSQWERVAAVAQGDARTDAAVTAGDVVNTIVRIRDFVQVTAVAIVAALGFAALLMIATTIRLTIYARRREIRIMQMVGATTGFIRTPFLLEGVFNGAVGAVLTTALLLPLYGYAHEWAAQNAPFISGWMVYGVAEMATVFGGLVGAGIVFGLLGSWLAVRRYLE